MSKILDLAKKLKALADRGIGGEKVNAERMLHTLMSKHNISLEEIEGEARDYVSFTVKPEQGKLFAQVACMVVPNANLYGRKGAKNKVFAELTKCEYIELKATFDFFWKAWERETGLFYTAFIHRNHIFRTSDNKEDKEDDDNTTPEEVEKIVAMMAGINKYTRRKELSTNQ